MSPHEAMLQKWLYVPLDGSELEVWAKTPDDALYVITLHLRKVADPRCLKLAPPSPQDIDWRIAN